MLFYTVFTTAVSGVLIMNGVNASEVVLAPAETESWKRVFIEQNDLSRASCKMLL